MELTRSEQLIILMLCEIAKKIDDPKSRLDFDPDFISNAVSGGHHWAIDWTIGSAIPQVPDSPEELKNVIDILDVWDFVEAGLEKLPEDERSALMERLDRPSVTFIGFDGNNETTELSIARFLITKLDRFARFADRDLNSHSPSLAGHMRMVLAFEPIRATLDARSMTSDELFQVLSSRRARQERPE